MIRKMDELALRPDYDENRLKDVQLLQQSLEKEGLLTPIRTLGDIVMFGGRRFQAAKNLGWTEIEVEEVKPVFGLGKAMYKGEERWVVVIDPEAIHHHDELQRVCVSVFGPLYVGQCRLVVDGITRDVFRMSGKCDERMARIAALVCNVCWYS